MHLEEGDGLLRVIERLVVFQATCMLDGVGEVKSHIHDAEEAFQVLHHELNLLEKSGKFQKILESESSLLACPVITSFLTDIANNFDGGFRTAATEDLGRLLRVPAWSQQVSRNATLQRRINSMSSECRFLLGRYQAPEESAGAGSSGYAQVNSCSDACWPKRTVLLEPGDPGLTLDGAGAVREVSPAGQAATKGVQVGWRACFLDGQKFSASLLEEKRSGDACYHFTFLLLGLDGVWKQEGHAGTHRLDGKTLTFSNSEQVEVVRGDNGTDLSIFWKGVQHQAQLVDDTRIVWDDPVVFGGSWLRLATDSAELNSRSECDGSATPSQSSQTAVENSQYDHLSWTFLQLSDLEQMNSDHNSRVEQKVKESVSAMQASMREKGARIVVMGAAGAGKSSCINAIFGDRLAATGAGMSVTRDITQYQATERCPIHIYDTKGFEPLADNSDVIDQLRELVQERQDAASQHDVDEPCYVTERLHAVWWVLDVAGGGRFDPQLMRLIHDVFKNVNIPIIIVLNKCDVPSDFVGGTRSQVEEHCPWAAAVVEVAADPMLGPIGQVCEECGSDDVMINNKKKYYTCEACGDSRKQIKANYGMEQLVQITSEKLPDMVVCSLLAAQKTWLQGLDSAALKVVAGYVISAAALGAIPVFLVSDAAVVAIQIAMLAHLTKLYDLILSTKTRLYLLTSLGTTILGTTIRGLAASAMKAIPFLAPAGMVTDAVMSALTVAAVGALYRELFRRVRGKALMEEVTPEHLEEAMSLQEQREFFKSYFERIKQPLMELVEDIQNIDISTVEAALYC
eukprot:TRINITY_DN5126_c0_g1_i8.p1 TRINITY_DN5126_c0_g1~~TRINITY_DN5126_c0_g1_i8.p1  ORF type:complete len:798 (-),score=129.70 TRINITY_DN5126_c0_g1_i8:124-2517(-)